MMKSWIVIAICKSMRTEKYKFLKQKINMNEMYDWGVNLIEYQTVHAILIVCTHQWLELLT